MNENQNVNRSQQPPQPKRRASNRESADGRQIPEGSVLLLGERKFEYTGSAPVRVEATEKAWWHGRLVNRGEVIEISKPGVRIARWMHVLSDGEEPLFAPKPQAKFPKPPAQRRSYQ